MSNNLDLTQVTSNQNQKEVTINDQSGELDAAFTEVLTSDYVAGNIILTDSEFRRNVGFKSLNLTVARTLTVSAIKRFFFVDNIDGTDTLQVIRGSTTLTMVAGEVASFLTDGTANGLSLVSNSNAAPFDIGSYFPGVPATDEPLMRFVFTRAVTFPSGLGGSQGLGLVAATAQTDVDIQKNGASVGTMRWAISGTVATFIAASPIVMAAGDELRLIAPNTPDATLADLFFTLAGTRG